MMIDAATTTTKRQYCDDLEQTLEEEQQHDVAGLDDHHPDDDNPVARAISTRLDSATTCRVVAKTSIGPECTPKSSKSLGPER